MTRGARDRVVARDASIEKQPASKTDPFRRRRIRQRGQRDLGAKRTRRRIERRYADLKEERLAGLAQELVRMRVDLIRTGGSQAALAAARVTQTIPIVFTSVVWPIETGLIDSFARPGRNLTGTSAFTSTEVGAKRLEFLREIAPTAKRLFQLSEPGHGDTLAGGNFSPACYRRRKTTARDAPYLYNYALQRRREFSPTAIASSSR